jgi:Tfp pilus assembly protein PilN
MRAVNLLPEKHRPRQATGGKQGSSYVLLGVLGAVVVAVLLYVLTANSINQAQTDIADANAAAAAANAQTQQLGAYGDFAKVKAQRVATVKELATSRMDWERMVRELARVLPSGVWIMNASAADSPANQSSSAPSSGTSDPSTAASGPTLTLQGCAEDQAKVADTLVRLKELQGATDVKLDHSATQADASSGGNVPSAGAGADCGATNGKPNYTFQVAVSFETPTGETYKPGAVPASLGGGQ